MKMMNKISKFLTGSIFCIAAVGASSIEASAYSTIFFDSALDTRNYQLVVDVYNEHEPGEYRKEDGYIKEKSTERGTNAKWVNKFEAKSSSNTYVAKNIGIFKKWAKNQNSYNINKTMVSKKLTVPAMRLENVENPNDPSNVGPDSKTASILFDAVVSDERKSSKNLSMVDGLNRILSRIETLKGGYEDDVDFRNTLMALGHLFSGKAGDKVVIGVNSIEEEVNSGEKEEEEEKEKLDPKDEDYEGNGQNIIVEMSGNPQVKTITIKQEGSGDTILYQEKMLIKADTGYRVIQNSGSDPEMKKIKVTKDGKTYTNSNKLYGTIVAEDVAYIQITNLIAHALIKYESGAGSMSGDGASMGWLEKKVFGLISNFITSIENTLGLVSMEDLVYNRTSVSGGSSRTEYVLGMYPKSWESLIEIVYVFMSVVSTSVLIFSVLKIFYKMTLDSMNIGKRMELKDEIASILQTVFMMVVFVLIFKIIAHANSIFVSIVYDGLGGGAIELMGSEYLGSNLISNVILRLAMIVVKVYLNVTYVIRGLNLALLYALAPGFIAAIAFGKKDLFAKYVQEIISNIFLQSFHAILLLFIFEAQSYINPGNDISTSFNSILTSVILTWAIMPTTKIFTQLCMNSTLMNTAQEISGRAERVRQKGVHMAGDAVGTAGKVAGGVALHKANSQKEALNSLAQNTEGKRVFDRVMRDTNGFKDKDKMNDAMIGMTDDEKASFKQYAEDASKVGGKGMKMGIRMSEAAATYNTLKKNPTQIAKGLSDMKKQREATAEQFKQVGMYNGGEKYDGGLLKGANQFSQMISGATGVQSNGTQDGVDQGYTLSDNFAKSLGCNGIQQGGEIGSGVSDGSTEGFMLTGTSGGIDNFKMPPPEVFKNAPEEVQNAYLAAETIRDARKEIKGYQDTMKDVPQNQKKLYQQKIDHVTNSTNERLKKLNVKQDGYLNGADNVNATLTVNARKGFGVTGAGGNGNARVQVANRNIGSTRKP